jgi:hypothetical protein
MDKLTELLQKAIGTLIEVEKSMGTGNAVKVP